MPSGAHVLTPMRSKKIIFNHTRLRLPTRLNAYLKNRFVEGKLLNYQ